MNPELQQLRAELVQARHDLACASDKLACASRRARRSWACALTALAIGLLVNLRPAVLAQAPGVTLASLVARITALEQKTAPITTTGSATNGYQVRFTKANVQIVNGTGSTATVNALGNLIIGYNETGNTSGTDTRTGSHNLIVGQQNNYSSYGGIVAGQSNEIDGTFNSILGGEENTTSSNQSAILGGYNNTASAEYASVSGGNGNTASGRVSSVSGGSFNAAGGDFSSVSGGYGNTVSNTYSSVSGGVGNTASGVYSSVSGGSGSTVSGTASSVSGGRFLLENNAYGFAAGGSYTQASPGPGTFHSP